MSKQRAEFTIWTKGDNRHLVRIEFPRDPITGRRRRVSRTVHGTRTEAKKAARRMLIERDHGIDISPTKVTVSDWLTRWLKRHYDDRQIGGRVRDRYQGIVWKHIVPRVGHVPLNDLRPDHIVSMKDAWLSGNGSTADRPLSAATVYKHLNVLRKALGAAVQSGIIARNPLDAVPTPSLRGRREQRALDADEIMQLVAAARGSRYDVPIRFTLATGLRLGEFQSLEWSDLDLEAGLVYCRGSKSAKSRRTIEMSGTTVGMLRRHNQEQLERRLKLGPVWQEHGLVFPSSVGTPWFRRTFYRDYKKVVYVSGLNDPRTITWHTLRHTAASQWIRNGVDIFTVSRRLGHASAAFTMDTYAHLLKGQQRHAAEALDHLLADG